MVFFELLLGAAIPAVGAAAFVVKYFWNKEKCFTKMANKIKSLDVSNVSAIHEHSEFDSRLNNLEKDANEIKIYLRQILNKLEITYS